MRSAPRTHKELIALHVARRREVPLSVLVGLPAPLRHYPGDSGHWRTDLEIAADLLALAKLIVVEHHPDGKHLVATWRLQVQPRPCRPAGYAGSLAALMFTSACTSVVPSNKPSTRAYAPVATMPWPVFQSLQNDQIPLAQVRYCSHDCPGPTPKSVLRPAGFVTINYYAGIPLDTAVASQAELSKPAMPLSVSVEIPAVHVAQVGLAGSSGASDHLVQVEPVPATLPADMVASEHSLDAQSGTPRPEVPAESPRDFLSRWAQDWQAKDIEATLAHYSDRFVPNSRQSIEDWRDWRRMILSRAGRLTVSVQLRAVRLRGDHVDVLFWQTYQSRYFKSRIGKLLRLAAEDGQWKIRQEIILEHGRSYSPTAAAQPLPHAGLRQASR